MGIVVLCRRRANYDYITVVLETGVVVDNVVFEDLLQWSVMVSFLLLIQPCVSGKPLMCVFSFRRREGEKNPATHMWSFSRLQRRSEKMKEWRRRFDGRGDGSCAINTRSSGWQLPLQHVNSGKKMVSIVTRWRRTRPDAQTTNKMVRRCSY